MKKIEENNKIKTEWNLGLLYKNLKDPQIEKDLQLVEKSCLQFAKDWKGKDFSDLKILLKALHAYEIFEEKMIATKPFVYFTLAREIDTGNQKLTGIINGINERLTKVLNETIFFSLKIGKIDQKIQKDILQDERFKRFEYLLKRVWVASQYQLSELEEKILALKNNTAYELWIESNEKALGKLSVQWKGNTLPINEASGIIATLTKQSDRKKLHELVMKQIASIELIAESEMNAVILDKKVNDTLRGFEKPYQATFVDYQNTEKEVFTLINAVEKSAKMTQRLFSLKKKILGLDSLGVYDMGIDLSASRKKYSFDDAVTIVRSAFEKVNPEYREIFDSFLKNGQIDVYSRQGKKGGGYCWGDYGRPTFILLNWNETFDAVRTLAHEMGHAIHAEYSQKNQGALYHEHPISTAEVASTLFENFVREELYATLSDKEQLFARYNYIQESCMTIHRQINHFQFEQEMYEGVYKNGSLSTDEINNIRIKYLKKYMGNAAVITELDGYGWISHSHMRRFFYVYSYAYGQLISTAMYEKYKQDPFFVEKINQFLSAGGSDTPANIFKSIGIDTADENFWNVGLISLEKELKQLEKDCAKMGLI
jgi:oligoendopeptidase F